jgi:hypothetical protein
MVSVNHPPLDKTICHLISMMRSWLLIAVIPPLRLRVRDEFAEWLNIVSLLFRRLLMYIFH